LNKEPREWELRMEIGPADVLEFFLGLVRSTNVDDEGCCVSLNDIGVRDSSVPLLEVIIVWIVGGSTDGSLIE